MIALKLKISTNQFYKNYVYFTKENFKLNPLDLKRLKITKSNLDTIIKNNIIDKDNNFLSFDTINGEKIILINLKANSTLLYQEKLGGKFYDYVCNYKIRNLNFRISNLIYNLGDLNNFYNFFIQGFKLKSYKFIKYKTKKESKLFYFNLIGKLKIKIKNQKKSEALINGINLTKDLVSEPGNILHPDEYVQRILQLRKNGLKVSVINKKKLAKMGMNALLGVGQGSIRGSYLVVVEWNGSNRNEKPLAFVGKGVCFDTGGISLKPAKFMEDMTYDMAGSAVVVGLMKTLALRKAKINAVGVVGLVENMPDGNAQRPGDIIKSYSGKTIEVLNTDAEGRLVLADALTYTEEKFKPKFIIDLATLTGAIIVSLGSEYAGLFSNDNKISEQLSKAGEKTGEKVWRMPLNENYNKLIESKKADMQNINYVGGAGSITAAQFLQRFILNKTPWAHLDIAGMAFSKYGGALNSGGATGYGVRLLNQLIEDNYE
jgi:leucyl aminopeptidase